MGSAGNMYRRSNEKMKKMEAAKQHVKNKFPHLAENSRGFSRALWKRLGQ